MSFDHIQSGSSTPPRFTTFLHILLCMLIKKIHIVQFAAHVFLDVWFSSYCLLPGATLLKKIDSPSI